MFAPVPSVIFHDIVMSVQFLIGLIAKTLSLNSCYSRIVHTGQLTRPRWSTFSVIQIYVLTYSGQKTNIFCKSLQVLLVGRTNIALVKKYITVLQYGAKLSGDLLKGQTYCWNVLNDILPVQGAIVLFDVYTYYHLQQLKLHNVITAFFLRGYRQHDYKIFSRTSRFANFNAYRFESSLLSN